MPKDRLYDDLRETLELWVNGNGTEKPGEECMPGIALVLELMKRAEERS
jgi:hypothetical protein